MSLHSSVTSPNTFSIASFQSCVVIVNYFRISEERISKGVLPFSYVKRLMHFYIALWNCKMKNAVEQEG